MSNGVVVVGGVHFNTQVCALSHLSQHLCREIGRLLFNTICKSRIPESSTIQALAHLCEHITCLYPGPEEFLRTHLLHAHFPSHFLCPWTDRLLAPRSMLSLNLHGPGLALAPRLRASCYLFGTGRTARTWTLAIFASSSIL